MDPRGYLPYKFSKKTPKKKMKNFANRSKGASLGIIRYDQFFAYTILQASFNFW